MDQINYLLSMANEKMEDVNLTIVANVDGITDDFQDYSNFSVTSEFLSELELDELVTGFKKFGVNTQIFYDEIHFIKNVLSNNCLKENKYNIVFNMAQKGLKIGRKSLIPAFCDLNNIAYVNSNPYVVSLCRNKYHSGNILAHHGFPVPNSWIYKKGEGWLNKQKPSEHCKVIVKLNNESASIGIDQNNIINFSFESEYLIEQMSLHYNQEIIVQEFIEGYEVEVPLIVNHHQTVVLPPMGIQLGENKFLGDNILTYDVRATDAYQFYPYSYLYPERNKNITQITMQIASTLGISGFGRIDYRIDKQGNFFVTDIATNPHIIEHSSFHHSFQHLGYTYSEMLGTLLGVSLTKIMDNTL